MTPTGLLIVPVAVRDQAALDALLRCLVSLAHTAPGARALLIDDAPVLGLSEMVAAAADELGVAHVLQEDGSGPVHAYNVGLEVALAHGLDAVLVAPDVEPASAGWLDRLSERLDTAGRPAAVVGGRVVAAGGLVEEAGWYYSLLRRSWLPRFRGVPSTVAESARPTLCPVGAQLTLVRRETIAAAGLLDPGYELQLAMLDYCLRVFELGLECVYEAAALAHAPRPPAPVGRDRDAAGILARDRLDAAHADLSYDRFVPDVL